MSLGKRKLTSLKKSICSQAKVECLGRGKAEGITKDSRKLTTGREDKIKEEDNRHGRKVTYNKLKELLKQIQK